MTERQPEVIIRQATALDAVNIVRALKASWELTQAAELAQVDDRRALEHVTEVLKGSYVIVADVSGRIVGAMACTPMRERWSRSDDWFLCEEFIAISPHWVTRGIGERLLAEVERFADEERLWLLLGGSLLSVNLPALLSHRPGYQRLGTLYLRMPAGDHDGAVRRTEDHDDRKDSRVA